MPLVPKCHGRALFGDGPAAASDCTCTFGVPLLAETLPRRYGPRHQVRRAAMQMSDGANTISSELSTGVRRGPPYSIQIFQKGRVSVEITQIFVTLFHVNVAVRVVTCAPIIRKACSTSPATGDSHQSTKMAAASPSTSATSRALPVCHHV